MIWVRNGTVRRLLYNYRVSVSMYFFKGIDDLPPPNIDFISETLVRVILPAREEYKLIPLSYVFIMQVRMMQLTRLPFYFVERMYICNREMEMPIPVYWEAMRRYLRTLQHSLDTLMT